MSHPSIKAVRDTLIAAPGKSFDLSKRDSGDRSLFPDKKEARGSLKKDAAAINELTESVKNTSDGVLTL